MRGALVAAIMAVAALPSHSLEISYKRTFGDWMAVESTDPMTDEKQCNVVYAKANNVFYTSKDSFKISQKGRGGVESFRYRFGKSQASNVETVKDYENDMIMVPVLVAEALDAPYLRISGTTVLQTGINIEISLKGLKEARAALATRCNLFSPLPSSADAPDWAKWQTSPPAGS